MRYAYPIRSTSLLLTQSQVSSWWGCTQLVGAQAHQVLPPHRLLPWGPWPGEAGPQAEPSVRLPSGGEWVGGPDAQGWQRVPKSASFDHFAQHPRQQVRAQVRFRPKTAVLPREGNAAAQTQEMFAKTVATTSPNRYFFDTLEHRF